MSIRVTSSGHNFSNATSSPTTDEEVTLLIECSKAMLLPTVLLPEESLEDHLRSAGIAVDTLSEEVIAIHHDSVTTALVALPKSLMQNISTTFGNRARFTTPLLAPAVTHGHDLRVHLSADWQLLCLSLYNGKDRLFAELFEVKSMVDVLYWITRIGEGYDLSTYTIFVDGGNRELISLLNKYYKSVKRCE